LIYALDISVKNALIDPVTLTFDLSTQNHVISRISQGHFIPYTKFGHFGIIHLWVMLRG